MGIRFHVETDHKPLVPLLGSKSLDELPPCIQRLKIRLIAFSYSISHVAGKKLATADVLSRAPLGDRGLLEQEEEVNLYVNMVRSTLPATEKRLQEIREHQERDVILSQVKKYCNEGWPDKSTIDRAYLPYAQVQEELSVENGLLLKGCRLVIPKPLQTDILKKLHAVTHVQKKASTPESHCFLLSSLTDHWQTWVLTCFSEMITSTYW